MTPPSKTILGLKVAHLDRPKLPPAKIKDPSDDVLFVRSFLITRSVVGVVGFLLSIVLVTGDIWLFRDKDGPRTSLSAYYYSEMGDVFVGALFVIGFMLLTYLSSRAKTWDFALSSFAGIMALGVALFPTAVEGTPAGTVAVIHGWCAALFIASLGVISILFALETNRRRKLADKAKPGAGKGFRLQLIVHLGCPIVMLGGGAVILFDWRLIGDNAPLFLGEVICVMAFSLSWLASGKDLLPGLGWVTKLFQRGPKTKAAAPEPEPHVA